MLKVGPKVDVGIGISAYQRYDLVSRTCLKLKSLMKSLNGINLHLCVADDGSPKTQKTHGIELIRGDNQGVSINKNRVLNRLKNCEYIFILEDDVEVKNLDFVKSFIDCGEQSLFYGPIESWRLWQITKREGPRIFYRTTIQHDPRLFYTPGSVTAMTKYALEKAGGLSARFKKLGLEHMEFANRLRAHNLLPDDPPDYMTLDWGGSLGFYDTERNPRDKQQSKRNEKTYYELYESSMRTDADYLDESLLFVKVFNKLFGIGLSKTGTTSLNAAFNMLGIYSVHFPIADNIWDVFDRSRGVTDITTVPFYKELDEKYPGSKFVLTVRNKSDWLKSLENHWHHDHPKAPFEKNNSLFHPIVRMLLLLVYGSFTWDEGQMSKVYDLHLSEVQEYFLGRDDLLVVDICDGCDIWDQLCPFIGVSKPEDEFPHRNRRTNA